MPPFSLQALLPPFLTLTPIPLLCVAMQSQGADVWFFRQEVQATQATIQACLSPSPGPGHTRTPTPTTQRKSPLLFTLHSNGRNSTSNLETQTFTSASPRSTVFPWT